MWRPHVFMAEAGDGAGTGAASGTGEGAGPATAAPAADASVLATGAAAPAATGAPAAAGAPADPNAWLPEKLRVFKDDKTLDLEASARKAAEGYGQLEKRMGSGEMPPKASTEYKLNVPEALKGVINSEAMAADPKTQAFLKDAHAKGMTQGQLDLTIGAWAERVQGLVDAAVMVKAEDCTAELKKADGWKTDDEYKANVQRAFRAGQTYAGADFEGLLKDYGNDPRVIRMLANVGKDIGADRGTPAAAAPMADADAEALTKSPAYWNRNDPAHEATKAKVDAHFLAKFGNKPHGSLPS